WLPRFREAYRALDQLARREAWSRAEIEAFQLERLNATWAHALDHVPHYRELRGRVPTRFAGLDEFRAAVPLLSRGEVQADPLRFLSERAGPGRWHRTTGSSGAAVHVFWSDRSHRAMLRGKYRFHAMWGVDVFDRTAFLWGSPADLTPGLAGRLTRVRVLLEDRLRNRIRLPAHRLGRDDLRRYLGRMAAHRTAWLYAYSTAAYLLAGEAEASGLGCDSLRLVTLSAEPAYPRIVSAVGRVFGVPVAVEYGSVECGFIAGTWPDGALRLREDAVLVETRPRPDGRYNILVTVLDNPAFPLLRYALGDVTEAPLEVPERGFARLWDIAGRHNDLIVTRTGRPLHWAVFDLILEPMAEVRCWRVLQLADGSLTVTVQPSQPGAGLDLDGLKRRLTELVEGYPVTVVAASDLPATPGGKHRWIVSRHPDRTQDSVYVRRVAPGELAKHR
ncbi:MAG TPA: hypothetical protein VFW33_04950, partial [Gemmataceae bacterium]|nr:hypothetical protein [Gemmataceae bacterium]